MTGLDPDAVEQIPPEAVSTYVKLAEGYGMDYYRSVVDELASRGPPDGPVLDAGTGPGLVPIELAERVANVWIHAFDFTRGLVAYGRETARERGVESRVSFFTADCNSLPLRPKRYSWVISTGVLHSLEAPERALEEFFRVLQPGGTAFVFDPTVLAAPDDPGIELTAHERAVFEAYGVHSVGDEVPIGTTRGRDLAERSPFQEFHIEVGDFGDTRLFLTRTG